MRFWVGLVAAISLAVLVAALVYYNNDQVTVHLLFGAPWETKLWAAMVASAVIGSGLTALVLAWPLARLKVQARRRAKRIHELEQEVHGLRTLPIASDIATPSPAPKLTSKV
jgi:uncharacterized integral membrane protein